MQLGRIGVWIGSFAVAAAALEWRGYATVRTLSVLRDNAMIDAPAQPRDASP
jgi:hypothetical protein